MLCASGGVHLFVCYLRLRFEKKIKVKEILELQTIAILVRMKGLRVRMKGHSLVDQQIC